MPMTRAVTDSEVQVSLDQMSAVVAGVRLTYVYGGFCTDCAAGFTDHRRGLNRCALAGTRLDLVCIGNKRRDRCLGVWKEVT